MHAVPAVALALAAAPIDVAGTPISRERLAQLLISDVWLRKEARTRGLYAPRAEVAREMRDSFAGQG